MAFQRLPSISIGMLLAVVLFSFSGTASPTKPTKAGPTSWQRQACEAKEAKQGGRYTCTPDGVLQCFEGWTGDLCNVPICKRGCDPLNGYCKSPGECRCKLGFAGEVCRDCALLPGCVHGTCNKSFECICKPGWTGLFCSQAICKEGCPKNRGFCEQPGECRCRMGWTGEFCNECQIMPGCRNAYCKKPLDCICQPGWTGILCQTPVCKNDCSLEHGFCETPNQCRCRVGWWGSNCDVCHPYPGCQNGYCYKPWECRCHPQWTGFLCDQRKVACSNDTCLNGGTCLETEWTVGDSTGRNNITCVCPDKYSGSRCQVIIESDNQQGKWSHPQPETSSVHPTPAGGHMNGTQPDDGPSINSKLNYPNSYKSNSST